MGSLISLIMAQRPAEAASDSSAPQSPPPKPDTDVGTMLTVCSFLSVMAQHPAEESPAPELPVQSSPPNTDLGTMLTVCSILSATAQHPAEDEGVEQGAAAAAKSKEEIDQDILAFLQVCNRKTDWNEDLFKQPPPKDDCPICFLRFPPKVRDEDKKLCATTVWYACVARSSVLGVSLHIVNLSRRRVGR